MSASTSRRLLVISLALGLAMGSRADASPPPSPPADPRTSLSLVAAPVFGADAATGTGWNEIVVRIDNSGTGAARGVIELSMSQAWTTGEMETAARAPFAVPGGHSAVVQIPTHSFAYYAPQVALTARTEAGEIIQTINLPLSGQSAPLLVEVEEPARLSTTLRGWPIPTTWQIAASAASSNALTVGSPGFDRSTGDAILPEHPSGYASATAVVMRSSRLVALEEGRRESLLDWVSAGGTIAIVPTRPEDLRSAALAPFVGGPATADAAPAGLRLLPAYERPEQQTLGATPAPHSMKQKASGGDEETPRIARIGPAPAVAARLAGYAGGNLRPSDFGASAPCGLGEVHLLAFDPMLPDATDDLWVQSRMVDLVARAWDRHAGVALPVGGGDRNTARIDEVRRALDPNENFRLGLGASGVLLVVYSLIVGPLVFSRATKRGRPLLPLLWVPIWSAIAFTSIVVIGLAGKGWRGRSRRVTLLEAGTGSALASSRAYRGFFASETRSLRVAPLDRASVLEVAPTGGLASRTNYGALQIGRDLLTLGSVTSAPWETVVVREDGVGDLRGGISLSTAPSGEVFIENHAGRALQDVIVHAPHEGAYFASIAEGARVPLGSGSPMRSGFGVAAMAGMFSVHPLGARSFPASLPADVGKRVADAWSVLEAAAGDGVDWWPEDRTVLIGELAPAARASSDSGLRLESERTFVRIVGTEVQR